MRALGNELLSVLRLVYLFRIRWVLVWLAEYIAKRSAVWQKIGAKAVHTVARMIAQLLSV
jgi:hypothetical protein